MKTMSLCALAFGLLLWGLTPKLVTPGAAIVIWMFACGWAMAMWWEGDPPEVEIE